MGKDREVIVKDCRGTKNCPDLFANIILSGEQNGHKTTAVLALSKNEAKDIVSGLTKILEE